MNWQPFSFACLLLLGRLAQAGGTGVDEQNTKLPVITTMEQVKAHEGQRARIEGRYEVAPIAGSKRLQPAVIVLSDGQSLIRFYRPRAEEFRFLDKRVVVTGKAFTDANQDPHVQQVMAPHVEAEQIDLAPDETPWSRVPQKLPTPPLAQDKKSFAGLDGRWVRVVGSLKTLEPMPDESFWSRGVLSLPDGSLVEKLYAPTSRWKKHVGQKVTIISRAKLGSEKDPALLRLVDLAEICPGDVERCGMPDELPPMQKKIR